jgi:hypothetical protein
MSRYVQGRESLFQADVVKKLCEWWSLWMHVPSFVENGVMGGLNDTGLQVDVSNILVRGRITEKNALKVMVVELGSSLASTLDADSGSKHTKLTQIRFKTMPSFKRCHHC